MKRAPSDAFFRRCGHSLIISAEGIRAEESAARAKKQPLSIRKGVTSSFYDGMTAAEALAAPMLHSWNCKPPMKMRSRKPIDTVKDLFGNDVTVADMAAAVKGRTGMRRAEHAYNAMKLMHGVGPEGVKCIACRHFYWRVYNGDKKYPKCAAANMGEGSRSTDWNSRWQACGLYEPDEQKTDTITDGAAS